jgi:methylthioribose-1-phosphate isomerase
MSLRTIWTDGSAVFIIDQTLLPTQHKSLEIHSIGEMWEAIRTLRIRGAPAIGVAAAFGVWLGVKDARKGDSLPLSQAIENACNYLATSRPTAVNLFWAVNRIRSMAAAARELPEQQLKQKLFDEATLMLEEDAHASLAIGKHGAELLKDGDCVLTHCNAGGLATVRYGTALAPVYYAVEQERKKISVFSDETRPLLQGARLTTWELMNANIPVTLICDNMAGAVMQRGWINAVMVGTDRVARNGDFANKIGTYGVAVLAREHGIPFYVAAPLSSIDISVPDGGAIPIEERDPSEVSSIGGIQIAPLGVKVFNPAFDVTPHTFVTAFITERGIIRPPYDETIPSLFQQVPQS